MASDQPRYLAGRFDWAAPGDQQEDAWLVRFCDKDCGEAIFTGPDAASEAWEHWNRYAPSYNIYVFRLAALSPALDDDERAELIRLRAENERLSRAVISGVLPDLLNGDETAALVDFIRSMRGQQGGS